MEGLKKTKAPIFWLGRIREFLSNCRIHVQRKPKKINVVIESAQLTESGLLYTANPDVNYTLLGSVVCEGDFPENGVSGAIIVTSRHWLFVKPKPAMFLKLCSHSLLPREARSSGTWRETLRKPKGLV